ncbi:MAG: formate dehydrogenase subunit alpha [Pseudomonadota bacterium]
MNAPFLQPKLITFTLDGETVSAAEGETIFDVAKRSGTKIPHLCHRDAPGYTPDGNCRACMVEIDGERTLAASCVRKPADGMRVTTKSPRVEKNRKLVFELLASDMPAREDGPDPDAAFWTQAALTDLGEDRRFASTRPAAGGTIPLDSIFRDASHPSIVVNLDACIACNLCERACVDVQSNDVIGMAGRGLDAMPAFDAADPMGQSTCVACGECVSACPTGALLERTVMNEAGTQKVHVADSTTDTVCPFCGVGCQTTVHVKDDKIIKVDGRDGPANHNRLCVKGRFGYDYVMSPDRLTKPLIRREDAPKSAGMRLSFEDRHKVFREATWDEALHKAGAGFLTVLGTYGSQALSGFGSAKGTNEEAYLFQKLIRQGFGTNNVDHCTRLCHASSVAALMEGIGSGAVSAPFTAVDDADCILVIGARPEQNHPVAATFIKAAAKRGAKLIVMDPRQQGLMRFATHPVVFKGGRDVALLNAMIHVIITEGLTNARYIEDHVDGFEALKDAIMSFSPEAMAPIAGVDADTIREVARTFATAERAIIFWGMGVSQHVHGTDNARALIALCLITGHVGREGTGLHPLRGQNNVQGASDAGLIPMYYPDYRDAGALSVRAGYEESWGRALDANPGLTVVEIINSIRAGAIRGMYIMGENPAMSDPDQQHAREALASLDHLVVQDIFLTETAWQADVIFPASAQAEKCGTTTNTNRQVQMNRAAFDPPGEARQDWELIVALANQMGLGWSYGHISEVYAEMASHMHSLDHIGWDRLEADGAVTYPVATEGAHGDDIMFGAGFPIEGGRAKLVPTTLVPPDEMPDDDYPMLLSTGRLLEHWHTGAMTRHSAALNIHEPAPTVSMHPVDIERLGLHENQMVQVETRRGHVNLSLRTGRDLAPGSIFIPFCFGEAPANVLTNPALDPYGKIPEFKLCGARVTALPT